MSDESGSPLDDEFNEIAGELWEHNADWWQKGFTQGVDPEYEEQIIPMLIAHLAGAKIVLDVGTGEGQLSRIALSIEGVEMVVGFDPTWHQIVEAKNRARESSWISAAADMVPFGNSSFDTVIACLVFEHIADFEAAFAEVARVIKPGGRFLFFLNHPLMQTPGSGWIDDHIIGEQYWRIGKYLEEERTVEEVEKDIYIPFIHRPLHRYLNVLARNSLFLTHMEEPPPPPGFLDKAPEYYEASSIPRLLFLQLNKLEYETN